MLVYGRQTFLSGDAFDSVIRQTVRWYLDNPGWVTNLQSGQYRQWLDQNYSGRKV